jgi:RNA-binding protein YhbY
MNLRKKYFDVLHNKALVNIGKAVVNSEGIINHISNMLKKEKILKIHALKSALVNTNIRELAEMVKNKTNSYLFDIRGHTFIISKYDIKKDQKF